jgi:ribosomal protein S19
MDRNRKLLLRIHDKVTERLTKAKYGGFPIIEISYPMRKKRPYTRKDVQRLIRMKQKEYKDKSHEMIFMPTLYLGRGYRSLPSFRSDGKCIIDLYGEESDQVTHFLIYVWRVGKKKGGCDGKMNDCLFHAIIKCMSPKEMGKMYTAALFKKILKVGRYDKVPLDRIPIEAALKININITGDHQYISPHTHTKTCNLKLVNEHYEFSHMKKSMTKQLTFKRQKLMIAHIVGNVVQVYNGNELNGLTIDEYYKLKRNKYGEYAIIQSSTPDIITEYELYMYHADEIKRLSNGKIRYNDMGFTHKNVAKRLFHECTLGVNEPDPITELEELWLKDAMQGGLMFGELCDVEEAICYDLNSAYPYALQSTSLSIPLKQGEFTKLDELPEILSYGIYHCVIEKSDDYHLDKLFRYNRTNKYTHIDIANARHLGLTIHLINNDEANALLYQKGRTVCSRLFGSYIELVYNLKKKGCKFAKQLMNTLWGALCEKNLIYKSLTGNQDEYEIPVDAMNIIGINPMRDEHMISYFKTGEYYKTKFARLGPFLTSFVRKQMAAAILPIREEVYRCHTDSILTNSSDCDHIIIGKEIGQFKIEKEGHCIVYNSQKVIWFEKKS